MIRALLLLLLIGSAFGQSVFVKDPATADSLGASATFLNTASATFTRTTSAYNPATDTIAGPGVRRTKAQVIGTTSYNADLIEIARTNLLAAGTDSRFEKWTAVAGGTTTADTQAAPNTEVIAQTLTDPGASLSGVSQAVTVANDSLVHVFSIYVLKTAGGTAPTFGIDMALTVGTGVTTSARINTDTGTQQYGSNANVSIETPTNTAWWRIIVLVTNNTTGNTTLTVTLYPAAAAYGASVDDAAATGTCKACFANLNKAGFATSFASNRNLLLQSQTIDNASWTKTRSSITADSTANPVDGASNADTINEDNTATNTHFITQTFTKAATPQQFTFSTYIKQSGRTWCALECTDSGVTNGAGIYFDVANGVKGTAIALGAGWSLDASTITAVGSWYRCSITVTTASATTITGQIYTSTADLGKIIVSPLNAAALICWGNQLVYGATIENYWGTLTSSSIRSSDVLTSATALSITSGTLIGVGRPYGWSINPGTTAEMTGTASQMELRFSGTNTSGAIRFDAGGQQGVAVSVSPGPVNGTAITEGMTWNAAAILNYVNGPLVGSDASLTPPYVACASEGVGARSDGTLIFCGWVSVFYWDATTLTPAQQQIFANGVAP